MENKILLAHGSGGRLTHQLIKDVFLKHFGGKTLYKLEDSAKFKIDKSELAFTTDSYVVKPIFFPGSDIGKLAIYGTVNDLAVVGAEPLYISLGMIIEEGLDFKILDKICKSISDAARIANVEVVTGDTKVVEKGSCDGIFINTSGVGKIRKGVNLSIDRIKPGDKIAINGPIASHGIAVLAARENLGFKAKVKSDCAPLNELIGGILNDGVDVKFMRDPTRGGLATVLNEIVENKNFGIILEEKKVPIKKGVEAACEILGFDPLYIGNEGKLVMVISQRDSRKLGKKMELIGEVVKNPKGKVLLNTKAGGKRIVDMLAGEQLPRIC